MSLDERQWTDDELDQLTDALYLEIDPAKSDQPMQHLLLQCYKALRALQWQRPGKVFLE